MANVQEDQLKIQVRKYTRNEIENKLAFSRLRNVDNDSADVICTRRSCFPRQIASVTYVASILWHFRKMCFIINIKKPRPSKAGTLERAR